MLGKAHSPIWNLDWNPSIIHHGPTTSFPLSLNIWKLGTQRFASSSSSSSSSSSCSCKSMATDFEKSEDSHHKPQPPAPAAGTPTVVRSTARFGRLKVQRVKIPQFVEKQEQDEQPPLALDDEPVNVGSDSGVRPVKGAGVSSRSRWQRSEDKSSEIRKHSSAKAPVPRRWDLSYDSLDLTQRSKSATGAADFFSRKSFRDVGCSEFMIECLRKLNFQRPSHIQAMSFAPVRDGKSCILADQSGSGKTLAYLAPVIQRLRQEEVEGLSMSSSQSPRLVVLVPTAELASQVLGVCRSMSKSGVPFRSMVVTGGFRQRTQLENLQQGVDVLIATPGRFMFLMKERVLQLSNLRCAVLDEVDILFKDEDFEPVLQSLISSSPVTAQYLFVTATLPVDIYNKLVEVFPDCEVIMGPAMHRVSAGLEEVLVDCSGGDEAEKTPETAFQNKKSALLQLVEGSPVPKTIVFCNKIETCRKVENALKRFDRRESQVQVLPFHAAMAQESRLANMDEFTNSRPDNVSQFLVCTDRASRGIDFAGVDHVVLFDFPRDPSEYVRRVGRTARGVAGKGKAFIFVVGKQVSLARRILERNRKGHPLHDVPSAYELFR